MFWLCNFSQSLSPLIQTASLFLFNTGYAWEYMYTHTDTQTQQQQLKEREAMNLKETKEGLWKVLEGGKKRDKWFDYIIFSKIKEK